MGSLQDRAGCMQKKEGRDKKNNRKKVQKIYFFFFSIPKLRLL